MNHPSPRSSIPQPSPWWSWGRLAQLCLVLGMLAAPGCGGDQVSDPTPVDPPAEGEPPTSGTDRSLTEEERTLAIEATEELLGSLGAAELSTEEFNQTVAAWFSTRPEFEAVAVDSSSSSIWARFIDGRLLVVANNREPGAPSEAAQDTSALPPAANPVRLASAGTMLRAAYGPGAPLLQSQPNANATELPGSNQVRLLHSFGPDFEQVQAPVRDLTEWFTAAGYDVVEGKEGDARVDKLRQVSGDGFFYLNTHGGKGELRGGETVYIVQSSSLRAEATDKLPDFKDDLDNGRLVYMMAQNGSRKFFDLVPEWDTRYAITHHFVDKYMSFGKNSLIFLNVCFSASANPDIDKFIAAMHKKGAGVYMGWAGKTSPDGGFRAVRYMVDRLLGGNRYKAEQPAQRAFTWPAVLADMQEKGFAIDPKTEAALVARPAPQTGAIMGLLAPTIMQLTVDEGRGQLTLTGNFGTVPGTDGEVLVNGPDGAASLKIVSWQPLEVVAELPRSGPGSAGEVVVTVRGHRSTPRQLLRWRGLMNYKFQDTGSLAHEVEMDLELRLDPGLIRLRAGLAPQPPPWKIFYNSVDTDGVAARWQAGGTASRTSTDGTCTYTDDWSGSGEVAANNHAGPGNYLYMGELQLAPRLLPLLLVAEGHIVDITETTACPSGTSTRSRTNSMALAREVYDDDMLTVMLRLNPAFEILGETRTRTAGSRFWSGNQASAVLSWPTLRPTPAYDPELPK